MSLNSLTCDDISPLLDAYHDGELDQAERNSVAAHLGLCGDCQAKLIEIESVVTSLKNLPKLQMARDLSADPEFLKRALELASVPSDSSKEKVGAEIKNFPGNSRKQSEPFMKKLFPVPGPVIFASVAAAAALALVIAVPRYLNNTAATGPSVASQPKQATPKVDENAHSTNASEGSAQADIKVAHNVTNGPESSQDDTRQPAHSLAQVNEANGPSNKELRTAAEHNTGEIASAQLPAVNDSATVLVGPNMESTNPQDNQSLSQNNQSSEERDIPASVTAPEQGELLALYPTDSTAITDELAIPTDEDGLYALKL